MTRIEALIASAAAYLDNQPAMAVVYLEQAEMAARAAGMHALADQLFNLYVSAKIKAFG